MNSYKDEEQSDYIKYRGKCKEYSEKAIEEDPSLRLVRGHYYCPIWGKQAHWWCEDKDGKIIDKTKDQFPSKGIGEYIEFNGIITCEVCNKQKKEEEAYLSNNHAYCSYECYCSDLM